MRTMGNQAEVAQEAWRDETQPVVARIAFVSGGMGGIGSAICRRLGRQGHTVVAGCLPDYDKKAEWLERMRTEGFRVHAAEGDVADFESCTQMFEQVRSSASRATRCSSA
jgi:acetoacetyl-CoA reductase